MKTHDVEPGASGRKTAWLGSGDGWILALGAVLYVPLTFLGPGSVFIAYRAIRSGMGLVLEGAYVPSRYPGYFVHEALTGILYSAGGPLLTNLATVGFALITVWAFLWICRHHQIRHRHLLATVLVLHPLFWIASTSTYDFVWAMAFMLLGYVFFLRDRHILAGVLLGIAVGTRLGSIVLPFAMLIAWGVRRDRPLAPLAKALLAGAVTGAALYIPPFAHANYTLEFLTFSKEPMGLWGYVARFVYKNIYFWGLPASLVLLAAVIRFSGRIVRRMRQPVRPRWIEAPILISAVTILGVEWLFLGVPQSPYYLLPILPFGLFLLGRAFEESRGWLVAFLIAVVSLNVVNIDIAQPDVPHHATSASLGLWVEEGLLLEDLDLRREVWDEVGREEGVLDEPEVE